MPKDNFTSDLYIKLHFLFLNLTLPCRMPTEDASVDGQIHLSLNKAEQARHVTHIKTLAGTTA